eukprot:Hpha_TRINITY_DN29673_c0_g1::TRINITY_DN29673_c0_g1_i1::g.165205::m.165205
MDADSRNLVRKREDIILRRSELESEGRLGYARDIWQSFCDLRRRRRALLRNANRMIMHLGGVPSDLPWPQKEEKVQAAANTLMSAGKDGEAETLLGYLRKVEHHHDDSVAWAKLLMNSHSVPLAGPSSRTAFKEAVRLLRMANTSDALREKRLLELARDVTQQIRWRDEALLDSDLDEDPSPNQDPSRPKYRKKTVEREVQRMLDDREYTKTADPSGGGGVFYVDQRTGRMVVNLEDIAINNLSERRADEDAGDVDTESDEADYAQDAVDGTAAGIAVKKKESEVPFGALMVQELKRIDVDVVGVTNEEKVVLARKRAQGLLDFEREKSQVGRRDSKGMVMFRSEVSKTTLLDLQKKKVQEEAQRMMETGKWLQRKEKLSGMVRFVNAESGEVTYDLLQVAEQELREKQNYPLLRKEREKKDDDSGSESGDPLRWAQKQSSGNLRTESTSRIHQAWSRKLSKEISRRKTSVESAEPTEEELIANEVELMQRRGGWSQRTEASSGRTYFVHAASGKVEMSIEGLARQSLEKRGVLKHEEVEAQSEPKPVYSPGGRPVAIAQGQDSPRRQRCEECAGDCVVRLGGRLVECPVCSGRGTVEARPADELAVDDDADSDFDGVVKVGAFVDRKGERRFKLESLAASRAREQRTRLIEELRKRDPERLVEVDELLMQWQGMEKQGVDEVIAEYKQGGRAPSPPASPEPHEGSPRRRERVSRASAERRNRTLSWAMDAAGSPRKLRRLLIRMYAATAPERLAGVAEEVAAAKKDPRALVRELLGRYGEDVAVVAWADEPPTADLLYSKTHLMEDAMRDFVGEPGSSLVMPERLSPVFRRGSPVPLSASRERGPSASGGGQSPRAAAARAATAVRMAGLVDPAATRSLDLPPPPERRTSLPAAETPQTSPSPSLAAPPPLPPPAVLPTPQPDPATPASVSRRLAPPPPRPAPSLRSYGLDVEYSTGGSPRRSGSPLPSVVRVSASSTLPNVPRLSDDRLGVWTPTASPASSPTGSPRRIVPTPPPPPPGTWASQFEALAFSPPAVSQQIQPVTTGLRPRRNSATSAATAYAARPL